MFKKASTYLQYIMPKMLLTRFGGWLAESRHPKLKPILIHYFINKYKIPLHEALEENPEAYDCFNDFFIRKLKPSLRPIANGRDEIASPADGTIAQIGYIKQKQLLQAKNFYYDLPTLLGNNVALAEKFYDGAFATIYLAPQNYHRVHMPLTGQLIQTIYVPGKLFSVNKMTSELIPQLYSRNERLISIFETEAGTMAVILIGAMIVGSIQPVWKNPLHRTDQIETETFSNITLQKGKELGHFKLGSTVIVLFSKNKVRWNDTLQPKSNICFGEPFGKIMLKN